MDGMDVPKRKGIRPKCFRVAVTQSMMREWDDQIKKHNQPAECPGCKTTRKRVHILEGHVKSCKEAEALFTHICEECNMGFLVDHMLADHNASMHGVASSATTSQEKLLPDSQEMRADATPKDSASKHGTASSASTSQEKLLLDSQEMSADSSPNDSASKHGIASSATTSQEKLPPDSHKTDPLPTMDTLSASDGTEACDKASSAAEEEGGSSSDALTPRRGSRMKKPVNRDIPETFTEGRQIKQAAKTPQNSCKQANQSVEQNDVTRETPTTPSSTKRPRGRPRKDTTETTTQPANEEMEKSDKEMSSTSPSSAKRGRPRKNTSETHADTSIPCEMDKQTEQSEEQTGVKGMGTTTPSTKRPRGRPKKHTTETDADTSITCEIDKDDQSEEQSGIEEMPSSSPSSTQQPHGRPRIDSTEADQSGTTGTNISLPCKTDKQTYQLEEQSGVTEMLSTPPTPSKRPRGRPKKHASETDTDAPIPSETDEQTDQLEEQNGVNEMSSTLNSSKRPRGRPKKHAAETGTDVPTTSEADKQTDQSKEQTGVNEMPSTPPTSAKRPRGRPKKHATETGTDVPTQCETDKQTEQSEEQTVVKEMSSTTPSSKRPRGRPKKQATETDQSDVNTSILCETDKQIDQSEKQSGIKDIPSTTPPSIKRPRGRPKKHVTETDASISTASETEIQADHSEEQISSAKKMPSNTPSIARPRGRPKKHATETDLDNSAPYEMDKETGQSEEQSGIKDIPSTTPSSSTKRPRGRPKKHATETDADTSITCETDNETDQLEEQNGIEDMASTTLLSPSSTKRPRGRPKKHATDTDADTSTASETERLSEKSGEQTGVKEIPSPITSFKRPRGRPRRDATETDSPTPGETDKQTEQTVKTGVKEMPSTPSSTKRPRGRPRSDAKETDSPTPRETDKQTKQTGEQSDVKEMPSPTPSSSTKRPRGRPKKHATETDADTSIIICETEKETDQSESGIKDIPSTTPSSSTKRPRGRPKKHATETDADTSITCEMGKETDQSEEQIGVKEMPSTSPSAKRPRGRPKKHATEKNEEEEEEEGESDGSIDDEVSHSSSFKTPGTKSKTRQSKGGDDGMWTPRGDKRKRHYMVSSDEEEDDMEEEVISIGYTARTKKRLIQSGQLVEDEPQEAQPKEVETETDAVVELAHNKKAESLHFRTRKKFAKEIKQWEEDFIKNDGVFATCQKCYVRRRSMETIVEHYRKCNGNVQKSNCKFCGREFQSTAGLKYHMMAEHASLGRKDASKEQEKSDLYTIWRKTGRLKCPNDGCGKKYATVTGYLIHKDVCGVTAPIIKCEKCGKEYTTKPGLSYHMKHAHPDPTKRPSTPESVETEADTESRRSKRKAASKALETIKDLDADLRQIDRKDRRLKKLFTSPERPVLPEDLIDKWRKSIEETGLVKCANEGCPMSFQSMGLFKHHNFVCKQRPDSMKIDHQCRICHYVCHTVSGMLKHICTKHTDEVEQVQLKDGELTDYSDDDDDDDDDDEDDKDELTKGIYCIEDPNTLTRSDFGIPNTVRGPVGLFTKEGRLRQSRTPKYSCVEMLRKAAKWTAQQHKERFCSPDEHIFQNLVSSFADWQLLNKSEQNAYEPVTLASVPFKVVVLPEEDKTFHKLQRYAVLPHRNGNKKGITGSSFFVGGPIWAMAWCPIPLGKVQSAKQYAVISCHRGMDDVHKVNIRYTGPGMVQLWAFGKLSNFGATIAPHLCMNLAHDYGCVWDLKWCPSGCWQDPDMEQTSRGLEVSGDARMGLLAMACSDGTVRVINVLHPRKDDLTNVSTYKPKPVLNLLPNIQHGKESAPFVGQCWCIEWLPRDKHTRIMACFSNGTIAIWDLITTSSLLQSITPTNGNTLYPVQIMHICDSMIRSMSWCPLDPNYIVTVCADKSLTIWDLGDPSYPVMTQCLSAYIDCRWLSHWAGFFASADNSIIFARNYSFVGYFESGYNNYAVQPTTVHKGCVWGLDVSDWLNAVFSADSGGDAEFMLLMSMDMDFENTKLYHFETRRRFLYFTDLVKLSDTNKKSLAIKPIADKCGQDEEMLAPETNRTETLAGADSVGNNDTTPSALSNECTSQGNVAATDQSKSDERTGEETDIERTSVEESVGKDTIGERTNVEEADVEMTSVEETVVEKTNVEQTNVEIMEVEETDVVERTQVEQSNVERLQVEETGVKRTSIEEANVGSTNVVKTVVESTSIEETILERTGIVETNVESTNVESTNIVRTTVDNTNVERTGVEDLEISVVNRTNLERTAIEESGIDRTSVEDVDIERTSVERTNVESTSVKGSSVKETSVERTGEESINPEVITVCSDGEQTDENPQIPKTNSDSIPPVMIKTEPLEQDEFDASNFGAVSKDLSSIDIPSELRTDPSSNIVEANLEVEDEIAQLLQVCQQNLTEVELATQDVPVENEPAIQSLSSRTNAPDILSTKSQDEGKRTSGGDGIENGKKKKEKKKTIKKLPSKYSEMSEDYGLVYNDMDMSHFANKDRQGWKLRSLKRQRVNGGMIASGIPETIPDQFPLQALHKICINPNFGSHFWVLTGGQAGIVRAHCMVGLNKPQAS